ncbi:AKAP7 2'5' RNA ligase-like domain-containing protein [Podospora aff. communis PSN243]|uniref:AKAP7 2'5' RNA ligase-like domain-containing protein n=1 Tax=Podospora aff. communis PSN243 TaxID=3040156 RepID=A0AAV9H2U7_9PEZI|nr:AKAP7 2'5' RNA ligase-like domain-containing protein [Podospora aff. communis PSN243]
MPPNLKTPRPSRPPRHHHHHHQPRPSPTHFLCIPLVTSSSRPQLSRSISAFRSDVCGPLGFGIPEGAVRPLGTLHLTLGVFSFSGKGRGEGRQGEGGERKGEESKGEEGRDESKGEGGQEKGLEAAVQVLKGLRLKEILAGVKMPVMPGTTAAEGQGKGLDGEGEKLKVTFRGLRSMQTDKEKATVLYAPPEDPLGRLQGFCEGVKKVFVEEGVMAEEGRPLLLHATVVNTVYVKGKGGRRGERVTVDAREVLEKYEDEVWMEDVEVEGVQICKMGAKKIVVDGEEDEAYEVEAEVRF